MRNQPTCQAPLVTLSIDPALHGLGVGVWVGAELLGGAYLPRPRTADARGAGNWLRQLQTLRAFCASVGIEQPDCVVVEHMEVYTNTGQKNLGRPGDLLELQAVSGACAGLARLDAFAYLPKVWKGQVPKDVMTERIKRRLQSRNWFNLVTWTGKPRDDCDIAHGVGIGLYHFGLL